MKNGQFRYNFPVFNENEEISFNKSKIVPIQNVLNEYNYYHDNCNINYHSSGEPYILYKNYSLIGYDIDKRNKGNRKNVIVLIRDILSDIEKNSCININRIKK